MNEGKQIMDKKIPLFEYEIPVYRKPKAVGNPAKKSIR
jgi:hypothetical protein